MKLKRYELEVFCKMLVDRHNKLKQDYNNLKNKCVSLEAKCEKLSNKLSASLDRLQQTEKNVLTSKPYKTVVKNNTELKKRVKNLEQLRNDLIQQLLQSKDSFVISELSKEDLEEIGFDTTNITDETMKHLASKLGEDYCEQLFWSSLDIIAESLNIPKK